MSTLNENLTKLLRDNPQIIAAWFDDPAHPKQLNIAQNGSTSIQNIAIADELQALDIQMHRQTPLRTLITTTHFTDPDHLHQRCQDEPIQLGCQVQPERANWVGTAGAPCTWPDQNGDRQFGILSNWHVMANGNEQVGRKIHQPSTHFGIAAKLAAWTSVNSIAPNTHDSAIADARIAGLHTISPEILAIGPLDSHIHDAWVGLPVLKSGRTTALTRGECTAIGATVRVGYGDFEAIMEDQDIFANPAGPFGAPGDSGSLIVSANRHRPVALLFAGNGELTIGNPIRYPVDAYHLSFTF